ncbi:J domain-containing protein [Chloropicon primus]|nr:J domain-containing protein [Chloropicon primus]
MDVAWLLAVANSTLGDAKYLLDKVYEDVRVAVVFHGGELKHQILGMSFQKLYENPNPRELVMVSALVYYVYRLLMFAYSKLSSKGRAKEGEKGEGEQVSAMPGQKLLASLPKHVGSSKKKLKGKGQVRSKFVKSARSFAISLVMYFGITYSLGGGGTTSDFSRALVAGQLRDGATQLVTDVLPQPSWHRESAMSWVRVGAVGGVLYLFFVMLLERGDDVYVKNAAGDVLYHTLDVSLALLHMEKWLRFFPKLGFVLYWRFSYGSMLAFIGFGLKYAFDLVQFLAKKAGRRFAQPLSIILSWMLMLPVILPLLYGAPLMFTEWNDKRIMKLHRNKRVKMFQMIWGVSAEKSYYQILGVPENASAAAIKKAFRTHSRNLHPDKNPDPKAQELFMKIKDAYSNLLKTGSKETVMMKQAEANVQTLKFVMDVLIVGMPYMFQFLLSTFGMVYGVGMYLKARAQGKKFQGKTAYAAVEFTKLLESQAHIEVFNRSDSDPGLKEYATKWLHPLKRAIEHKRKASFKVEYPEEKMKEKLVEMKGKVPKDDKKKVVEIVSFGMVHRMMYLLHKKLLLTVYLEDYAKKDEIHLEKEVKDLDDLITTYTEELQAFGEQVEEAYDLNALLEDPSKLMSVLRYKFRKELHMESDKRLEWMKGLMRAPWYEYPVDRYMQQLSKYK